METNARVEQNDEKGGYKGTKVTVLIRSESASTADGGELERSEKKENRRKGRNKMQRRHKGQRVCFSRNANFLVCRWQRCGRPGRGSLKCLSGFLGTIMYCHCRN
jgi:hypothetical protein